MCPELEAECECPVVSWTDVGKFEKSGHPRQMENCALGYKAESWIEAGEATRDEYQVRLVSRRGSVSRLDCR